MFITIVTFITFVTSYYICAFNNRALSSSCDLYIRIVLNFNFAFKVLTDRNKRSEMLWSVNVIQVCYVQL